MEFVKIMMSVSIKDFIMARFTLSFYKKTFC